MSDEIEKRVTRSTKSLGASNTNARRPRYDEDDVYKREGVHVETENHKSEALFDDAIDKNADTFYPQPGRRGKTSNESKSDPTLKYLAIRLKKVDVSERNTPRKALSDKDRLSKEFEGDSETPEESVSEGSEYEPNSNDESSEELESEDDDEEDEAEEEEEEEDNSTERRKANGHGNKKVKEWRIVHMNDDNSNNDSEGNDDTVEMDEESEDEAAGGATVKQKTKFKKLPGSSSKSRKKLTADNDYDEMHLNPEEYFESQSEKIVTSNSRLKATKLDKETIDKLLENNPHISDYHTKGMMRLYKRNVSLFRLWYFMLEEGFSILLHGLGSKRSLIHDFQKQMIKGRPALIINGFFPSLTLKEILDGIIKDLMDLEVPTTVNDCMELIEETLKKHPDDKIYLLIHNIDGPSLRAKKIQDKLSYLASFPNLHLIASVDHINASLLWDNAKRARFNFYWCNGTTFLPYKEETLYENSLMVRQSGALALSSLHNVFLSLPEKSRSVYIIVVKHQIKNANANYQGMAFKDLYNKAREGFFVTNEITLRSQLTEFLDHKLIKEKRGVDGIQYLTIPLDKGLLQQFLEQHEDDK